MKRYLSKMLLVLVTMLCGGALCNSAPAQRPASPVEVTKVIQKNAAAGQNFVASVVPLRVATIGSAVDGRVVEIPWKVGDRVEEKGPLAKLLTQTIQLEVVAAEAQLKIYVEELRELKNGSRAEEKSLAAASVAAARARVAAVEARTKYLVGLQKRVKSLFDSGRAATQEELEKAVSDALESTQLLREAQEDLLAAMASQKLVELGPREEKIAQSVARVAMQQAIVDRLNDQIAKYTIISRFSGYVIRKHTEEGEWVKRGDPVADVAALDSVHIVTNVVDHHIPYVKHVMEVRVELPAISDQVFTGVVDEIVPQGDARARTFPVNILLRNEVTPDGPLIKSGMFARVTLPTGAKQDALFVPKDALVLGGPSPVVYVVVREGSSRTVQPVPVQLGIASDGLIQVEGKLSFGQEVVTRGNERLRPGQAVSVKTVSTR
jgi:RND family efflux transporter MFP subunit